jgi:hypothetical protein
MPVGGVSSLNLPGDYSAHSWSHNATDDEDDIQNLHLVSDKNPLERQNTNNCIIAPASFKIEGIHKIL